MNIKADLHIHPDWDEETGLSHGDSPVHIARGVVEAGLDVYGTTPHVKWWGNHHSLVREAVDEMLDGTGREVLDVMGVELDLTFGGQRYHTLYLFEGAYGAHNLPALPDRWADFEELARLKREHPGVVIIPHPTLFDSIPGREIEITDQLMEHPLVDGIELINGQGVAKGYTDKGHPKRRGHKRSRNFDIMAEAWGSFKRARENGAQVAAIGASDAHIGYNGSPVHNMVGTAITRVNVSVGDSVHEVFEGIRNRNTRAVPVHDTVRNAVRRKMRKVRKMGRYIEVR